MDAEQQYKSITAWSKDADENSIICKCRSERCIKKILSFSQLSKKQQNTILKKKLVSDYLHETKIQ